MHRQNTRSQSYHPLQVLYVNNNVREFHHSISFKFRNMNKTKPHRLDSEISKIAKNVLLLENNTSYKEIKKVFFLN